MNPGIRAETGPMALGQLDQSRQATPDELESVPVLAAVRVMVVDDSSDIRTMLRLLLGRDARFAVVAEATNGQEAVDLVGETSPDLIILDRQMPVMGGLEAIPLLREASPRSDIVLYTAAVEEESEKSAIAAGAVGLLEKHHIALSLVEDLSDMLVHRWEDPGAELAIRVGPVSSEAARLWVANSLGILHGLRRHPDVLPEPVSAEVLDFMEELLISWSSVAAETEMFVWAGRARAEMVRDIVEDWARVDTMSDAQLAQLGCQWSPPEARPFFHALTQAVLDALERHEATRRLAERLRQGPWTRPGT